VAICETILEEKVMKRPALARKATKSFDIDEGVNLPHRVSRIKVNDFYLLIANEKASFITTNEIGNQIFTYFKNGYTIEKIIGEMKTNGMEMEKIVSELHSFLVKVERKGFYEDAEVKIIKNEAPSLHLDITNECNLNCIHCFQAAGKPRANELSVDEWLKVIEDFSTLHRSKVTFSGGEPLLYPGIFELLSLARQKGLEVGLFSNGTQIENQAIVKKLEKCVDKIQLSLDGATRETNDKIRGKGTFEKVFKAFDLLRETQISLVLAVSVMPQNVDELKTSVEKLANRLGPKVDIRISRILKEGRANASHIFPNKKEGQKEIEEALSHLYKNKLKTLPNTWKNTKVNNCGFAETIVISSIGDVYPCNIYEPKAKVGNIRQRGLLDMVKDIAALKEKVSVENSPRCSSCDLKIICSGGCRLNNIYRNDDILIPSCTPGSREELCAYFVEKEETFDPLSLLLDNSEE
jgi:radical SAM protein with 4Fe4S-binding SPASM domain